MRFEPTSLNHLNHNETQETRTGMELARAVAQKRSIQPLARVASILLVLLIVVGIVGSVAQAQTIRGEGTFAVLPPISLASTGTTQNSLNGPFQVKVGADGSLYVADSSNKRIVKYVPSTLSGYSGCPGGTLVSGGATSSTPLTAQSYCVYLVASGLASPIRGVAVNSAGDVYFNLYPDSTGSAVTTYYYLQYRGLPSASGTTCGTNATNCSGGYNGYNCASQIACTNYTSIHTTNDIGGFGEGMFVDTYGSAIFTAYEGKSYTTAGYTTIERPSSAVTPSTVVNGNVTVLGTPPPTTAASYSEAYITGIGHVWDATEDQWGNIILAGYTGGVYVVQCGNGSSCTPSTSSFTGAKNSTGNGYGGTAGTVGQTTPYPTNIAAVTTAYSTTAGGLLTAEGTGETCDGVTIDGAGNLYASCYMHTAGDPSARIYKFPLTSAGAYTATGYDLTAYLTAPGGALTSSGSTTTTDALQGISFDPTHPNVVYGAVSNSATNSYIIQLTLGANGINGPINMGSSPIGTGVTSYVNMVATASTAAPASIYAVTLDSSSSDFAVVTSTASLGNTNPYCNVGEGTLAGSSSSSAVGGGCVVGVTFTPSRAGTEYGAVIFASSSAVLGWGYLEGTGLGAVATFQTPVEKIVATGLANAPTGLTLDNSGNLYYTATGLANITQLAAGTWTSTSLNYTTSLSVANSIAIDGAGILYVANSSSASIQKFLPNLADSLTGFTQSNFSVGTAPTAANGVSVDPYGSVYIANTGANQILIEPWNGVNAGTGWGTEVVLSATPGLTDTSLSGPKAVTVDASGNVYVADSGNGRVLKYTLTTPITAATAPQIGGVYVPTYTASLITSTTTNPAALALDANGSLYIADAGTNKIYKETYSGGSYTESIIATSNLSGPSGIVVATNGNIFIADTGNNRIIEEDVADAPTVAFGSNQQGIASAQQTVTLVNDGNAALSITIPGTGNNPALSNTDYSLYSSGASDCPLIGSSASAAGTVAAGASCLLPITFTPSTTGSDPGTLVITDNSNTVATTTQTLTLTGTGTPPLTAFSFTLAATTVGVAQNVTITALTTGGITDTGYTGTVSFSSSDTAATLPGSYTFVAGDAGVHTFSITFATPGSQTLTVTDALSSLTATQSAVVTGPQTISFTAPSTETYGVAPITLSATATSGLPVTFSITSGSSYGTLSGTNNDMLTITGAGSITIAANQIGNTYYTAAPQVTQTIVVGKEQQAISFTQPATPVTYSVGLTISLSATGGGSGNSVTFSIDGTSTGTGSITGSTLTVTNAGSFVIDANQLGNTNYASATQVQRTVVVNQASQTIGAVSGLPASAETGSAGPYTLSATATSGLPVTFSITSGSSYGTLSGTNNDILTVNPTAVGTITIAANQAGNANYSAATPVSASIVITNLIQQNISWPALTSPVAYGISPITLSATGGASGNPVVFSVLSGPGSVSGTNGSTLTVTGVGTIVIAANQAGNSNYSVAAQVTQNLVVNQATQTLSAISGLPTTAAYGSGPYTLSATGGASGNPVTFSITSGSGYGTLSGANNDILTLTGAGTITIAANQAGTANYSAASQVTATIVVSQATQTLSAISGLPTTAAYGSGPYTLSATGGASGNPVTFSITSGSSYGTLSGTNNDILTITGAGTITIAANQAGTANYSAASQVTATIVVSQATQTLSAISGLPTTAIYGAGPYTLSATGGASGNPVTFSITSGSGYGTLSGTNNDILTITGAGSITIAANQAGTANYSAASQITATIVVSQIAQTITFAALTSPVTYGVAPITLSATGGASGNPVTFSITSGSSYGTLSGTNNDILTITGAGSITIAANQTGTANYAAAPQVTQTIVVNTATQSITFPNPGPLNYGYGIAPITLMATASSGLPITYALTSGPATISGSVLTITGPGQLIIMATQAGNAYYAPATPVSISFAVIAPDFSVAITSLGSTSTLTILQGASGTATFTITPVGGFNQTVQYSCSGLPANSSCTFNPASAAVSGATATATMTISTIPQDGNLADLHSRRPFSIASFLLPGGFAGAALLFVLWRRKSHKGMQKLAQLLLILGFLGAGMGITGCGVNSVPPTALETPVGTSTITITAATSAAGGTSHSATFTLVIAAR